MLERPIITLTTDFGLKDPFVGIMKGVIMGINPSAEIVDISHNISPHNVFEAAHVIAMGYKYFPKATIHVVVVDPEVGSKRRPVLVITEDHYFIGPDNGVFTLIIQKTQPVFLKVIHITASHYYLPPKGPTFHGRDIFAPVAAWFSKGVESTKFGELINDYVTLQLPLPQSLDERTLEGSVVHMDSFGNAITNITKEDLDRFSPEFSIERFKIAYKNLRFSLLNYYSETEGSDPSAVINSFGFLELFTYKGSASNKFGIQIGDKVSVTII